MLYTSASEKTCGDLLELSEDGEEIFVNAPPRDSAVRGTHNQHPNIYGDLLFHRRSEVLKFSCSCACHDESTHSGSG